MGSSSERRRIRPLELPRPWRDCASCDDVWKFPLRKRVRDGQTYLLSKNDLTADRQNGGSSVL